MHKAHQGSACLHGLTKEQFYWPRLENDCHHVTKVCKYCTEHQPSQQKETFRARDFGKQPFELMGGDIFLHRGKSFLLLTEYFMGWIDIHELSRIDSLMLMKAMAKTFSIFGSPCHLHTDGGAQFTSEATRSFLAGWGTRIETSSPYHQQDNGKAESAVKKAKALIDSSWGRLGVDPMALALVAHRNTPRLTASPPPRRCWVATSGTACPGSRTRPTPGSGRKQSRRGEGAGEAGQLLQQEGQGHACPGPRGPCAHTGPCQQEVEDGGAGGACQPQQRLPHQDRQ